MEEANLPPVAPETAEILVGGEGRKPVSMQRVFIKFTNGKVAVFSGPAIFTTAEMKLTPMQIVDLAFSEPFEVLMKVPVSQKQQETPSEQPKS